MELFKNLRRLGLTTDLLHRNLQREGHVSLCLKLNRGS